MSSIVRLQERDLALCFFLRDLAEDVLREVILELAERGHAVVDPVEQEKNRDTGSGAAAEPDEQALQ